MADWKRTAKFLGPLAAGVAGAVWGYRLIASRREAASEDSESSYISLEELLMLFRSEDIAHCLGQLGLPTGGKKRERIDRVIDMAALPRGDSAWGVSDVVAAFRPEDLERVCSALGIETDPEETEETRVKRAASLVAALQTAKGPAGP